MQSIVSLSRLIRLALVVSISCATVAVHARDTFHLLYNPQGSLISVHDYNSEVVLEQGWSAWGERQEVSSDEASSLSRLEDGLPMRWGYTGHKHLVSIDRPIAGDARIYDPQIGRFLNTDDRTTGGIKGTNRFSYAYNNPLAYVDPDGRAPVRVFGANDPIPASKFISAVVEIPPNPTLPSQMITPRDREIARLETQRGELRIGDLVIMQPPVEPTTPRLTLGVPSAVAPVSGRAVSFLAGHTNLMAHAMGWNSMEVLDAMVQHPDGYRLRAMEGGGRFIGGGFIMPDADTLLLHPWSSFKAAGDVTSMAITMWERSRGRPFPVDEYGRSTINPAVPHTHFSHILPGDNIEAPPAMIPVSYWRLYIDELSNRTQALISLEDFESNRFTWYESKHGSRRHMMIGLMREYPDYFSAMETTLRQIIEDANERVRQNRLRR